MLCAHRRGHLHLAFQALTEPTASLVHSHAPHPASPRHAVAPVSAAPLPLPPELLKRSASGAFNSLATAGDTASMLGDILQRGAAGDP
jgi:hypothetical protein